MIKKMDMGLYISRMEAIIKENGRTIKCMALENCIIKVVKLLTRDIGKMTSSMGKEESITQRQRL